MACISGCECKGSSFDGHHDEKVSVPESHHVMATQHKECVILITILENTNSGEHKVRHQLLSTCWLLGHEGNGTLLSVAVL